MNINKIYNENCLDTMKRMEDNIIDLTITSPPYDNLRTYHGYAFNFQTIANDLFRVTKFGGVVVWVIGDATIKGSESGESFRQALYFKDIGFNLHDTMLYQKAGSRYPASRNSNRYSQIFEYMFIFSKGKPKTVNLICDKPNKWAGSTNWGKRSIRLVDGSLKSVSDSKPIPEFSPRENIWRYNMSYGFSTKDKIAHEHPAIFPEALAKDHIISWSNPGDLIYDPFMGSGTTAKMAIEQNRNYIGSEISFEYCNLIERRLFLCSLIDILK